MSAADGRARRDLFVTRCLMVSFSGLLLLSIVACSPSHPPASEAGPSAPSPSADQAAADAAPRCEPSETRTCSVLYLLADEYDDEHVLRTEPYFEEAGYRTVVASNTLDVARGFHECYGFTPATPDLLMDDVDLRDFDVVLFTGGDGVSSAGWLSDRSAHRLAQQAMEQGMVIAAIGDAPALLARAGLLEGRTVTVLHDPGRNQITDQWIEDIQGFGAVFVDESPVRDGLLITADRASAAVVWAILEVVDEQHP